MVLAELFITFEVVAFLIFIKGIEAEKKQVIYPLISMTMFLTLAVTAGQIESIFYGSTVTSWMGIMFNYMFGLFSFMLFIFTVLEYMRSGMSGKKNPEEV